MTPDAMRLKSRLRDASRESGLSAQALLQGFMLERLLARLSLPTSGRNWFSRAAFC